MSSLFNIEVKYLNLMRQIEDLEGEITEELEKELSINKDELESKIKGYHHIILSLTGDMQIIDDETKRLSTLKKTKENLIKRLKKSILEAVNLFGYNGKSGNKKLDFDTIKLYTKDSQAVNVNEDSFYEHALELIDSEKKVDDEEVFIYKVTTDFNREQYQAFKDNTDIPFDMTPKISKDHIKSLIEQGIEVRDAAIVKNQSVIIK